MNKSDPDNTAHMRNNLPDNTEKKELFARSYPEVSWEKLTEIDNIETKDLYIHYLDIQTEQIYTWNYSVKKWGQLSKERQKYYLDLHRNKNGFGNNFENVEVESDAKIMRDLLRKTGFNV